MYLIVTRLTQRHKVPIGVRATAGNRQDMVDFLHWCDPAFLQALFTQRVSCHVSGTDSVPCSAVLAGGVGCSLISIVLLPRVFPVLLTVLAFGQVGTAGIGARSLGLPRHGITSFCGTVPAASI